MTTKYNNQLNNPHQQIKTIIKEGNALEALNFNDFDLREFLLDLNTKIEHIKFIAILVNAFNNTTKSNNNNSKETNANYEMDKTYLKNNLNTMCSLLTSITMEINTIRDTFLQSNIVKPYLELKEKTNNNHNNINN